MNREYTREMYLGANLLDQGCQAGDLAHDGRHCWLSWRDTV